MSLKKKFSVITILFVMVMMFMSPVHTKAATIGTALKNPEAGWQRFDDQNSKIYYQGVWDFNDLNSIAFWSGDMMASDSHKNYPTTME